MKYFKFNIIDFIVFPLLLISYAIFSVYRFLGAGHDDTWIMLWAGKSFLSKGYFTNYNYEFQEIASSISMAIIAGISFVFSQAYVLLVYKIISLILTLLAFVIFYLKIKSFVNRRMGESLNYGAFIAFSVVFMTAFAPSLQYWTLGGLETSLYFLCLVLFLVSCLNLFCGGGRYRIAALACSSILLILTRAEGIFVFTSFFLMYFCFLIKESKGNTILIRDLFKVFVIGISFFVGILLIRYCLFDSFWPNPVYSKVGISLKVMEDGLSYWIQFHKDSAWGVIYACASFLALFVLVSRLLGLTNRYLESNSTAAIEFLTINAGLILILEIFIILTGGNWMGYFRFFAPILFMKISLVLFSIMILMKQYGRKSIFAYLTALLVLSSVEQTRATGFVDIWAGGMGSCSAKTSFGELSLDVGKLNDLVLRKNCAYQRDVMGILPFIEKNLSEIYSKIGRRIVFASYQAGFFPYHLRELFSEKQVFFLDTVGLANLDISKVSGIKNSIGHVDGTKIDRLFCGESGVLSSAVKGYNVDLIYALGISNEDKKRMQDCNYQVIYERPGAIVFADMSLPTDVLALFPSRK